MPISASSLLPPGGVSLGAEPTAAEVRRSTEAAQELEAVFASMLIKEMRQTLSEGLFGSDTADVYGALFDQHIGQQMTQGEGLGIKQMILAHEKAAHGKS
jgi:Rod binding domain-containing protein